MYFIMHDCFRFERSPISKFWLGPLANHTLATERVLTISRVLYSCDRQRRTKKIQVQIVSVGQPRVGERAANHTVLSDDGSQQAVLVVRNVRQKTKEE
jgi:hypothetical protein